ncbi:MAG: DUF3859 domain-containing protein [Planctomycetota bacterium]
MSRILFMIVGSFVFCLSSCAPPANKTAADVRVLDYGIYEAVVLLEGSFALGQTPRVASVQGIKHLETTTDIPCEVGTFFGCRLDPATLPRQYEFRTKFTHPPFAEPGGELTNKSIQSGTIKPDYFWDGRQLWFFLEGFEYEMIPGTWSLEIWIDNLQVADFDFDVR